MPSSLRNASMSMFKSSLKTSLPESIFPSPLVTCLWSENSALCQCVSECMSLFFWLKKEEAHIKWRSNETIIRRRVPCAVFIVNILFTSLNIHYRRSLSFGTFHLKRRSNDRHASLPFIRTSFAEHKDWRNGLLLSKQLVDLSNNLKNVDGWLNQFHVLCHLTFVIKTGTEILSRGEEGELLSTRITLH